MSPFGAVISRLRSSPKDYSINQYLEGNNLTNQASGLYDSLLSVNTVIENPSYNNHGDTSLLAISNSSEYESDFTSVVSSSRPRSGSYTLEKPSQKLPVIAPVNGNEVEEQEFRQRKGSYSIEKPSPLLLAYRQKIGDNDVASSDKEGDVKIEQSNEFLVGQA